MKRSIRSLIQIIFLITFMMGISDAHAQTDTSSYSLRQFDGQSMQKYSTQKDFTYDDNTAPDQMGILAWLWYQFLKLLGKLFSINRQMTIAKVVVYVLMIFAIVMLVLNLAGIKIGRFFKRDGKMILVPEIGEENIREMNMDDLIADAAAKKQWRLTIRYQYLKALRLLTDRELIRWQPGKTNRDYYYELKEQSLKNTFLGATDDFENTWYGNSEVTETHYRESKISLENFYTQIQNYQA